MINSISSFVLSIPPIRAAVIRSLGAYRQSFYTGMMGGGVEGRNQDLTRSKPGAALAYQLIVPVFRSVGLRSQAVSATPWKIRRLSDGVVTDTSASAVVTHPLARMLLQAQRVHNESVFYLWEMALSLYGENYIQKCVNRFQVPAGLSWLNPLGMMPQPINGRIAFWNYLTQGGNTTLYPAQVSFDRIPDPADDLAGYGPTYAALQKINIDNNAHRWWAAHFRNGARPDMIVSPDGEKMKSFTEEDQDMITETLRTFNKGVDNAGRTRVFPFPMNVEMQDPVDLSKQIPLTDSMETDIYTAYGVNRQAAGDTSSMRYKTDAEVYSYFNAGVIAGECKGIALEVNSTLMPFAENCDPDSCTHRFEFDLSAFDNVTAGEKSKNEEARADLVAGRITLNESRLVSGMKPTDEGDIFYLPSGIRPTRPEDLATATGQQPMSLVAIPQAIPAEQAAALPAPAVLRTEPEEAAPVTDTIDLTGFGIEPGTTIDDIIPETAAEGYACISFAGQPDIVKVQGYLAEILGDKFERQPEDRLHLTLFYGEALTDEQMYAAAAYQPTSTIILSSSRLIVLGIEEKPALCAEVIATPELLTLQRDMVAAVEKAGGELSEYSKPEAWRPHITLGYIPEGLDVGDILPGVKSEFFVLARSIAIQRDDYRTIATITLPTEGYEQWRVEHRRTAALDEVTAWEHAVGLGKGKAAWAKAAARDQLRTFEPVHTRGDLSDFITEQLSAARRDKTAMQAVFAEARRRVEVRAIGDTEVAFADEFYALLEAAAVGDTERRQWAAGVRRIIRQYGRQAYRDGLVDGGVDEEEFSPEDELEVSDLTRSQSEFVTNLGKKFFSDGLTMKEIATKPEMWANKSLTPFYTAGLASANRNQMMEFGGEDGEESCDTCQRLKGQRHRIKDWRRRGLVPREDTDNFECGGWHCEHKLVPAYGRAKGSY